MFLTEVTTYLDEGQSVAIFTNFNETIVILKTQLRRHKPVVVRSGQTLSERHINIARFQDAFDCVEHLSGWVWIVSPRLNGGHPRVALINPTWSGQDMLQALGRIHRVGGKSPCKHYLLYCAETLEEKICRIVDQKIKNHNTIDDEELDFGALLKRLEKRNQRCASFAF